MGAAGNTDVSAHLANAQVANIAESQLSSDENSVNIILI